MDVIQAVAGAELIVLAEAVVHLSQKIDVVNRIRVLAGGKQRTSVTHRCEAGVDTGEIRRRDRDDGIAGLV